MASKLHPGQAFPAIHVKTLDGITRQLGQPENGADWQMIVLYRGRHCPLCTQFLNELEHHKAALLETGVDLIAVSADSLSQLEQHTTKLDVSFPLGFGLTEAQMKTLGVYISHPRSEKETDHRFSEPALFVVNAEKQLHVVDYSNNPFVRPELGSLVRGLKWIRDPKNNYPIRGTAE